MVSSTQVGARDANLHKEPSHATVARLDDHRIGDPAKLLDDKSPGVKRVEALAASYTNFMVLLLLFSIFLLAYAYDLDGTIRYTYQATATSSFGSAAQLSTLNVVRSVIGAAAQPTYAKLADVFGRYELILFSIFFYVIGTIIESVANNIAGFAGGVVLFQIGYSGINILCTVLIGDMITLRYRTLAIFVPLLPYLVNVWISGNITSAVYGVTSWRWGMGMFAIIIPVCGLPLVLNLWYGGRRAKKMGVMANLAKPFQGRSIWQIIVEVFWLIDVPGILLVIIIFGFILVPLTVASNGTESLWHTGKIIAPLVIGFVLIPVFIIWERSTACKHPLVPFKYLKDRGVWAGLGLGLMFDFAWYMQGDYLYTILIVAYDQSVLSATRITSLFTFCSVLTGTIAGAVIALPRVQRLKPFIVFGTLVWLPAFGMLIYFRGVGNGTVGGVIGAQILLGFGTGFFSYPTIIAIQASSKHEQLALVTGLYLGLFYIGSAFGSSVSGAVYSNILPGELQRQLSAVSTNTTLPTLVYGYALGVSLEYPVGSVERTAIIEAFKHVQRILCIIGICLVVPMIGFACCLRDPKLIAKHSLKDDDQSSINSEFDGKSENSAERVR